MRIREATAAGAAGLFPIAINYIVPHMKTDQAPSTGFVDFKQVKAGVSMLQILERYQLTATLKQNGDRLSGPCPIHKGKNPTAFRVSISKNCFNCFGSCGRGGNVIDFVSLMEGVGFREAAILLQDWFLPTASGIEPKRGATSVSMPAVSPSYSPTRTSALSPIPEEPVAEDGPNPPLTFELKTLKTDHPYLIERRLEPETIEHFGLGLCSRGMLRGYIAIPIHNRNGDLVAYAGRWPGDPPDGLAKYKLPKGFRKSQEIFNLHRALEDGEDLPLVIVEGFFDCFALWQAGVTKCVALMGSSISPDQLRILVEALPVGTAVEILFDNDEAGAHGATTVCNQLGEFAKARIVTLPEGVRQPDELSLDAIAEVFA
jgi:DNA primase